MYMWLIYNDYHNKCSVLYMYILIKIVLKNILLINFFKSKEKKLQI